MTNQCIPNTDSIEELARCWDTHDLTKFGSELEEVRAVFSRRKERTVEVALTVREVRTLEKLAKADGVDEATLVHSWVREKLRASSAKPPLQPTAHKTGRG